MQVDWKYRSLERGCGHGVEVHLRESLEYLNSIGPALGFIEWQSSLTQPSLTQTEETSRVITVFLDSKLKKLPKSLTTELQLAILLHLTDKNQKQTINNFVFIING